MTAAQARRVAVASLGLAHPKPAGRIDVRHFRRVLHTLGVVQLDSVTVLCRAHYMPFYSRLGPYPADRLDAWLWGSGEAFEYPGHEASVMPVELYPTMRHRMADGHRWNSVDQAAARHPDLAERVMSRIQADGPLAAGDLQGGPGGGWWGWRPARLVMEQLVARGELAVAFRDGRFVVHYDLPERVIPARVLAAPTPDGPEARRELVDRAVRALGVADLPAVADYWRMGRREAGEAVDALVARGRLQRVEVQGWTRPAYVSPDVVIPRSVSTATLVSPFDPLVWYRPRVAQLFGFDYRIEIYVPADRRRHGYYVLPFLLDDRLVARVDLKADRREARLRVLAAYGEDAADRPRVVTHLAEELRTMAGWLGLREVEVGSKGDLAALLRPLV